MNARITRMCSSVFALALAAMAVTTLSLQAKDPAEAGAVPVRMTVTAGVEGGKRMPEIQAEDVFVKSGKERLRVVEWIPAKGEHAGLELFLLIDDASDTSLGTKLEELRNFLTMLPSTTSVGVGYMRNAGVQIVQDFTANHALAAKSLRLPMGTAGAYGSPYLSVMDLMKRWPATQNRREVVMVTDGIDRAGRGRNALLNPDVDSAANVAQRTGTIIHTIYSPGIGRWHRNFWAATSGENAMAKLSDATGGESFFLGLQSPVSFSPYLDQLQKIFDSQYLLSFESKPQKKAGLQHVTITTELAGVDLAAADAAWVPATK